ncbi:MAG TPA: hypothetical protein VEQ63_12485 [Bryobacteraceae bacterium]|nr:hypothetical protein [Bryobacteraceae bacterium]
MGLIGYYTVLAIVVSKAVAHRLGSEDAARPTPAQGRPKAKPNKKAGGKVR